ncbi:MAG: MFS transporter [Actinobacteria bacterium]|nr:MFS transporter [Actinomycetota bacterium]
MKGTLVDAAGAGGPDSALTSTRAGASRQGWLLAVTCVAQFMVILDLSIVNVALPSIQSSLHFSSVELQWVVDAYSIVFAGFLMLAGRATDLFGQRRTFVAALALFSLTSLVGGLSINDQMLMIARGLQGLSGAMMAAASLAIITSSFPEGPARHRAIGLWGAMNGAGGAAGTLLGGIITQELTWRWVLLINPPIGVAAALVAYRVVANRRRKKDEAHFDIAGALTLTIGQLVLVYGIVDTGVDGWSSARSLVPIVAGVLLLGIFGLVERHFASSPLVPLRELTGPLKVANLIVLLFSASLFAMWYVSSLYLQQVLGLSPLDTGLAFLPMTLMIMLGASQAGKLVGLFGVRAVLAGGLLLLFSGMVLMARVGPSGSALGYVVLPGVLTAAGIGLSVVPSTIFATQGAGAGQAGLASGLVNTSRQVGAGVGLALLATMATQATSAAVGHNVAVPQALTDGFGLAYLVGAGFVALAIVATLALAREHVPIPKRHRLGVGMSALSVVGCFAALDFALAGGQGPSIGAYKTSGAYSFVSAPGLHPPKVRALSPTHSSELAPGYIMMANFYDISDPPMTGQSGPLIMDNQLQPVWFQPLPKDVVASNLEDQVYNGRPVLTWWQGTVSSSGETETGEDVVVNQHYQTVATLRGSDGWVLTMHEMLIRGDDAWVTANKTMPMDLSRYGGPVDGVLDDSAVQEYDISTGKLLYSWDALGHIPLSSSQATMPANGFPWDAYHVNSISFVNKGEFLVSMRNTWAAYLVKQKTGSIVWELGGKHSSFAIPKAATFQWQHDVKWQGNSLVTMYDDNCCQLTSGGTYVAPDGPSRGLELKLDMGDHSVSMVAQYVYAKGFDSAYMGDMQLLANGNVFIGWGSQPNFSEYSRSGKLLLNALLPGSDLSYRAEIANWVGLPLSPPQGAARSGPRGTTIYASWNGATEVASWKVLAGNTASHLAEVASTQRSGFETQIVVKGSFTSFKVEALSSSGQVIGRSKSFSPARSGN